MPPVPSDIQAAAERRATIREDGDAVALAAALIVQYEEQRRKLKRLVDQCNRARSFNAEKR